VTSRAGPVTVCIPAFQAEAFIDRTLRCARAQTYQDLRIDVSVDRSTDRTEEICRGHAGEDPRVRVTAHAEPLGWVGNVNHLLDAATGELAFVYFHDDVIEPTYVERLAGALADEPHAASAHCTVVLDDEASGGRRLRPGFHYRGDAVERLLAYHVAPQRGELLRSMVRRSGPPGHLRMEPAAAVYEMQLVASGEALHVADPLYRRIVERRGGMTTGWNRRPFEDILRGVQGNVHAARGVVDAVARSTADRELLETGLAVYFSRRLRTLETANGADRVEPLAEEGLAGALVVPAAAGDLPTELRDLLASSVEATQRWTAGRRREVEGR
jgi:glycosyltransferase involved in cell wall biosynthesis